MREGVGAVQGSVDDVVAADFPGLAVWSMHCDVPRRRRSRNVERRIAELDDRVRGIAIGGLRNDTVAGRYRALARQVGLDPDVERNALDEAAMARLQDGRFKARRPLEQALLVGMLETGIPLWGLDASSVAGWLRVFVGEDDAIWIGDDRDALAPMLGQPPDGVRAGDDCERAVVFALRVGGVSPTTIEEAFWHVHACLAEEG